MQSKTSFFSPAIFKKNLSRFYLLAILYLAAQCIVLPLFLRTHLIGCGDLDYADRMRYAIETIYLSTQLACMIAFCGAVASAMAVFSYLYSARSANMMAALPIRRESMFLSCCASVYAVVIVSNLIAVALTLLLTMPMGLMLGKWLIQWLFIVLGQFTLFFGIAVFSAHLTGNILAMPALYLVLNLAVFVFGLIVSAIGDFLLFGVQLSLPDFILLLSPIVWLNSHSAYCYTDGLDTLDYAQCSYAFTPELIVYTLVGAALLIAALLLYRKRAMETAGDVISVRILRPVFKLLFTLGFGLIGGITFFTTFLYYYSNSEHTTSVQLLGSTAVCTLVGYILSEMIIRKSTTRLPMKKLAAPALILTLLVTGTLWCLDADVFGMERYIPAPEDIQEVQVSTAGASLTFTDTENIGWVTALHHTVLDNRERNERDGSFEFSLTLQYELKNGRQVQRNYDIHTDDIDTTIPEVEIANTIFNSPDGILARKQPSVPVTESNIANAQVQISSPDGIFSEQRLTAQEASELYTQCIYPDMKDGHIGLINIGASNAALFYPNQIEIWFYGMTEPKGDQPAAVESVYFYTYPTTLSSRTNAWLEAHNITLDDSFLSTSW